MELFKKNKSICKSEWHIEVSPQAALTVNLIRSIVESLDLKPNPDLQMIPLSIGKQKVLYRLHQTTFSLSF